jgi:hypothetical protein
MATESKKQQEQAPVAQGTIIGGEPAIASPRVTDSRGTNQPDHHTALGIVNAEDIGNRPPKPLIETHPGNEVHQQTRIPPSPDTAVDGIEKQSEYEFEKLAQQKDQGDLNKGQADDNVSKSSSDVKKSEQHPGVADPAVDIFPDANPPPKKKLSWPQKILNFVRAQWFLITMGILIIIASQVQVPEDRQARKNDLVGYITVSVIFFLTGCTLNSKVLLGNYKKWKVHLWVQIQCFLMASVIMYALVSVAATNKNFMDPGLLCGMILTGTTATTVSSNIVMVRVSRNSCETFRLTPK